MDFIAKLAALVPRPRANLTRYHGVLAPNSKHRVNVTPAKRGKGSSRQGLQSTNSAESPADKHREMTWAQRLKRVFNIDITICSRCGRAVKIIASIEDPLVIKKILDHLDTKSLAPASVNQLPEPRAPPQTSPTAPASAATFASLPAMYAEALAGMNTSYFWNDRAHLGLTGYGSMPRWLVRGAELGFQEFSRKPFMGPFGAVGVDAAFGFGPQDFFAEVTRSFDTQAGGGVGAVVRSVTTLRTTEMDVSVRYYGQSFANPYARPVSAPDELDGLRARDETGLRLRTTSELGPRIGLRMIADGWRRLSSGALRGLLFSRADVQIGSSWAWAAWAEYRNSGSRRFVLATRLAYQPGRRLTMSGQLQHRWVGATVGGPRFQQDVAAILNLTTRPIDVLRLRVRLRYDFEHVWDNHRLPQTLWAYLEAALTLRARDTLRARYDLRVFLDRRESTLVRTPNPEHWLALEYVFRY